jgi:hypothetical protein
MKDTVPCPTWSWSYTTNPFDIRGRLRPLLHDSSLGIVSVSLDYASFSPESLATNVSELLQAFIAVFRRLFHSDGH